MASAHSGVICAFSENFENDDRQSLISSEISLAKEAPTTLATAKQNKKESGDTHTHTHKKIKNEEKRKKKQQSNKNLQQKIQSKRLDYQFGAKKKRK